MKLEQAQATPVHRVPYAVSRGVHKDTHTGDMGRQLADDRSGDVRRHKTRALLVENEAQRIRAGFDGDQGVLEVRNPANFDGY